MDPKVKAILEECRTKLRRALDIPPGESVEFNIRVEGLTRLDTTLQMRAVEFFTRERFENSAKDVGLEGNKHAASRAVNHFIHRYAHDSDATVGRWIEETPDTTSLLRWSHVGPKSCLLIWKALAMAGVEMLDTANIARFIPKR
jgi:hypothetical protein